MKKYHYHWINPDPYNADGDADSYKKRCSDEECPKNKEGLLDIK